VFVSSGGLYFAIITNAVAEPQIPTPQNTKAEPFGTILGQFHLTSVLSSPDYATQQPTTSSMEQSPSRESNSSSGNQEIHRIL
jgi:hypothetical protein